MGKVEPLFDRAGETVAWRYRDVLYALDGRAAGFVRNTAFFALNGRYLGACEDGLYRDPGGAVIAFEREATGGPLLPLPLPAPIAPVPELRPMEPSFEPAPRNLMRRVSWSRQAWNELMQAT